MEAVHWVVVGGGLAAVTTAYTLLEVPGGDSDAGEPSVLYTLVDIAVYSVTSGTLVYGAVSGYGVAAFASYFTVATLESLVRRLRPSTTR